ncbi:retrovirus-related Pol polyprotein from transposon 17.6 [Trichonephila clavipes]|uniref:RNA-directed DNA polymerase n=1 Tax=Trichonephila clavipes TaxID=2585209 RepID=A0A8X6VAC1_TRICX|nr:retrovirus-related Pol polyprotein from transposon 17.6 [Trichonephila clavipes]
MKPPHNSKEVSKFLGMFQLYAKFIKTFADICEPLYNLKRNIKRFIWSIEAQKAFDAVKAAITKSPVLKFPDFKNPFQLFTDASSIGVEAVLNQEQRPLVFASRTLSAAERNYTVTERECLAVVWALNKFRAYLGYLPIKIITDHAALTDLTTGKNLSNRMIRWALKLAEFNIVNDWVLVATYPLSSGTRKVVAKFKPIFDSPYRLLDVKNNNVVIRKAGERLTINVDQDRIYRHRKCDETEIETGNSDNGSLRNESNGFDRVQRRSKESRDGKKNCQNTIPSSWSEKGRMIKKSKNERLGYKRSNESRSGGPERKVQKGSEHRLNKRNLSSNDSDSVLPRLRKKTKGRDGNAHRKRLQSEIKKREKRGVPTDHREGDTTRRASSIQK